MLIHIYSAEAFESYEWDEFHVYRHPVKPKKFFVHSDSGCSCDCYQDPSQETATSETPLNKSEVRKAFSRWWDSTPYRHEGTKVDHLQRLNEKLKGN